MSFLIVGLGNPGREYEETRHNVGFRIIGRLTDRVRLQYEHTSCEAVWGEGLLSDTKVFLAKPMTFVNNSGRAVRALLEHLSDSVSNLLVLHDDLDLPLATVRIKQGGGSGGHHGLESIVRALNSSDFDRLRIGIGRPPGRQDPAVYVLRPFAKKQREEIGLAVETAADAVQTIVEKGIDKAMADVNRAPEQRPG